MAKVRTSKFIFLFIYFASIAISPRTLNSFSGQSYLEPAKNIACLLGGVGFFGCGVLASALLPGRAPSENDHFYSRPSLILPAISCLCLIASGYLFDNVDKSLTDTLDQPKSLLEPDCSTVKWCAATVGLGFLGITAMRGLHVYLDVDEWAYLLSVHAIYMRRHPDAPPLELFESERLRGYKEDKIFLVNSIFFSLASITSWLYVNNY